MEWKMSTLAYNKLFYKQQRINNLSSAKVIVPMVMGILAEVYEETPISVIDLGCGTGNWLSVFKCMGAAVTGVDGGAVPDDLLMIDKSEFKSHDFREMFCVDKKYSLAMSLECAEHLTEPNAKKMIDSLTTLSDIIMFSAAIPHQRGKGHINEHYQSYWVKLFNEKGYQELDIIRSEVWNNPEVRGFYAENIFLYVKTGTLAHEMLNHYTSYNRPQMYDVIHPQVWNNLNEYKVLRILDKMHENKAISSLYYRFFKK